MKCSNKFTPIPSCCCNKPLSKISRLYISDIGVYAILSKHQEYVDIQLNKDPNNFDKLIKEGFIYKVP